MAASPENLTDALLAIKWAYVCPPSEFDEAKHEADSLLARLSAKERATVERHAAVWYWSEVHLSYVSRACELSEFLFAYKRLLVCRPAEFTFASTLLDSDLDREQKQKIKHIVSKWAWEEDAAVEKIPNATQELTPRPESDRDRTLSPPPVDSTELSYPPGHEPETESQKRRARSKSPDATRKRARTTSIDLFDS